MLWPNSPLNEHLELFELGCGLRVDREEGSRKREARGGLRGL